MKKQSFFSMNLLIFSALMVGSCRVAEPLPDVPNTDYSIIDGDTVKTIVFKDYKKLKDKDPNGKNYIVVGDTIVTYREPKLHTPPAKAPDLSKLKNNEDPDLKGKPLRMVAIGGSLTAGVRDGGYFNEGILTSYPNLIARQMRLSKFEQPLFDTDSYNGFGRKTRTGFNPTGGPVPKFNEVKNNSGVEIVDDKTLKFKTYRVKETLDNFATPDFVSGALHSFNGTQDYERFGGSKVSKELFYRLFQQRSDNPKFVNKIFEKKFDFIIVELGLTEILNTIFNSQNYSTISLSDEKTIFNDNVNEDSPLSISPKLSFLRQIKENKTRFGCLLNVPDILEVPYFKQINQNLILKNLGNIPIKYGSSNEKYKYLDINKDKLLPFSSVDSLLSSKVHISLKRGIYNNQPLNESVTVQGNTLDGINFLVSSTNLEIANLSRKFNFPIVDINSLYKNIINKKYVLDSGIIIDANSFFSSDGIYPSITGQVIIANEVIKTLNLFYETEIPLISMQEYIAQ